MGQKASVNIRLQQAIKKHFGSAANLCSTWPGLKEKGGSQSRVAALIHFRESPLIADGTFSPVCHVLSEALGILPEKLFPIKLYRDFIPEGIDVTAIYPLATRETEQLCELTENADNFLEKLEEKFLRARVAKVIKTLSYRDREIIRLRFGIGDGYTYTLEEVGHIFKMTRERIRQIEAKAVHRLQQHERSQELVGFLD